MQADWEREYVEFVTARMPGLRRMAYQLSGETHRADDLIQQTFTTLYVQWRRIRAVDHLDAYVRAMLVRAFLSETRQSWWRRVTLTDAVPEPVPVAGQDGVDRLTLRAALNQVPARQRAVLVLRFLYDLPVAEVAELLGCAPGTVKSQTSHGLATLRRLLSQPALQSSGLGLGTGRDGNGGV